MKKARHYLGYRIVRRRKIGSVEYVIGHNPDALLPYACWNYNNGIYNFGYYCKHYSEARRKFYKRCRNERNSIRTNSWVKMVFICIANIIYKRKELEEHEYENTVNNT